MFPSHRSSCTLFLLIALALEGVVVVSASAQVQTGTPQYGSFSGGPDVINVANLNSHLTIPVIHKPGRGTDFTYDLTYDSSVWYPVTSGGTKTWQPVLNWGWHGITEILTGYVSYDVIVDQCIDLRGRIYYYNVYTNWIYHDSFGVSHDFSAIEVSGYNIACTDSNPYPTTATATANDGSGYVFTATKSPSATVSSSHGTKFNPPLNSGSGAGSFTDRNGNQINVSSAGAFTDTLGMNSLSVSGVAPSNTVFTYTAPSGAPTSYTMKYTPYTLQTAFGCTGVNEYGSNGTTTAYLVSEIDLPDGSKYTFAYEQTPGVPGHVTGRLASVTLPTGGTISYIYTGGPTVGGVQTGIVCTDGSASGLKRYTPDTGSTSFWEYDRTAGTGAAYMTTVTDPQSNKTVVQFQGIYETQRQVYQGSGTLFQTTNTCYNAAVSPCTGTAITLPIAQRTTLATIPGPGNLIAQHTDKFDSFGNVIESDEYDFATAAPFPLLRQTLVTYASLGNNLNAFRQTVTVKDGSGNIKSRQDTNYDQYSSFTGANCITGAPNHDDTGHGCSFTARANATSTISYTDPVTPSGGIIKNFTFDSLGNLRTAQLNCCQLETLAYSSATGYAYPDFVTKGSSSPQLTTATTYDLNMGLVLTSTDPNSIKTTMTYDNVGRPLTVATGSLPATKYTYTDSGSWSVEVCSPAQGTQTACQNTILDGLGRTKTAQLLDGSSTVYSATDTQYDSLGRAYKTSNPYAVSPSYWTQLAFDVLGRAISTTFPDNSVSLSSYTDNAVTTTDPAGRQRKAISDGLGHLKTVYEPDPANGNSLTLLTSYTYNVLDQVTQITQGAQSRTYLYDALGRLNSATTPEAGTVCFGTLSGSTCQSNGYDNYSNPLYRTDARGVVTNYLYDTLNRLVGITYLTVPAGVSPMPNVCKANGSTSNNANVCFNYGTSASNLNNGRIVSMYDSVGSESYAYDSYGNILQLAKVIGSMTYTTNYLYNYANQLSQITYPSGRAVAQNLDTLGRLSSVVGTINSTPYASGFTYNPAQLVSAVKYGNNLYASFGFYQDTLLLQCLDYSTTNRSSCAHDSTTKFGLSYSFPASPANNGQIAGITDAVDNGRTAAYTYDSLYRLTAATTTGSAAYPKWGLSETYDRYGNRTTQTVTAGSGPTNSVVVSASTNRISGSPYAYDAGGNMTNDGQNTLVYDGENRIASATNGSSSGTYAYDGNGHRVQKISGTTSTVYVYSGSKVIAEYDATGDLQNEYVYAGGNLLASIPGITNGNFEQGSSNWSPCDGGATVVNNPAKAHAGNDYLQISTTGGTCMLQNQIVPVSPGDQVIFGGWAYKESGSGGYTHWKLEALDINQTAVDYPSPSPSDATTGAWTYQVGNYTVPSNVAYVRLYAEVYLPTSATVARFDDGFLSAGRHYYYQDHLSNRLVADTSGNVVEQLGHFPFGESWYNASNDKLLFTSYERDSESGNDYAMARSHINRLGRFSTPDLVAGSTSDPQSLNRYPYVENDSINGADPLGLYCYVGQAGCHQASGWVAFGIGLVLYDAYGMEGNSAPKISWLPFGETGGGRGSGERGSYYDPKRLELCALALYNINLRNFVPSMPGQNGSFIGDLKGKQISVENDVRSFTKLGLAYESGAITALVTGAGVEGLTPKKSPNLNYTASDLKPEAFLVTQLHELGHSLNIIAWMDDTEDLADNFVNCVFEHGLFKPKR